MKIAFVGEFGYNNGSSHAVYNYCRVGERRGHEISVSTEFGSRDEYIIKSFPLCRHLSGMDRVVFVFEGNRFLTEQDLKRIVKLIPRSRRVVLDPDGRGNGTVIVGDDSNHDPNNSKEDWHDLYRQISDLVLQPTLAVPQEFVVPFLYYGYEEVDNLWAEKQFSILYVGNNWNRWNDIKSLLTALEPKRARIGRIGIKGQWWDGTTWPGKERITTSDPAFLRRHSVEVSGSVPFGSVINAMSEGEINPIFVRPMLAAQGLATPRMLETFSANTIPILTRNTIYSRKLFGDPSDPLFVDENPADKILEILDARMNYLALVKGIRKSLRENHNYERRLDELLELIG